MADPCVLGGGGAVRVLSPLYREPVPPGKPCDPGPGLPHEGPRTVWGQGLGGKAKGKRLNKGRPGKGRWGRGG